MAAAMIPEALGERLVGYLKLGPFGRATATPQVQAEFM
jgi:hypothetical protein